MDIKAKVNELSKFLDDEAIALALKLTPEAVKDIREGRVEIRETGRQAKDVSPVVHVNSVKIAYRQKIIAVCRTKGGVGATVIALGLAHHLSKELRVLLADFTFAEGGGDLAYYLNLPEYPHLGVDPSNLEACTIEVDKNFYVLQPPRHITGELKKVEQVIDQARQDYDAVIMDLPNHVDDNIARIINQANTLLAVTGGMTAELVRLAYLLRDYQRKDIIVVTNGCTFDDDARKIFAEKKILNIKNDNTLNSVLEKCELPREKSPFMRGIAQLSDAIFDKS